MAHETKTPYERLEKLVAYIETQIVLEEDSRTYNGTQKVIAYTRVLNRLKPIMRQARKIRQAFNFEEPS